MSEQIKLPARFVELLPHWPEDGKGFQFIDVILRDGRILKQVVVVGDEFEWEVVIDPIDIIDIRKASPPEGFRH